MVLHWRGIENREIHGTPKSYQNGSEMEAQRPKNKITNQKQIHETSGTEKGRIFDEFFL